MSYFGSEPRAAIIARQIDMLLAEAAKLENRPVDDFADGDVVLFDKRFGANDRGQNRRVNGQNVKVYTYAAVKGGGLWWVTGDRTGGVTWDQMMDFVEEREKPGWNPRLRYMSEETEL